MSQESPDQAGQMAPAAERIHEIKTGATWFLVLGIVMVIVGVMAVGSSLVATLATVMAFGVLLLVGGGVQIVGSLACRRWSGFFLQLAAGILYIVVGFLMLNQPAEAATALTLLLTAFLLVTGTFRIVIAIAERFQNWGWMLLNGVITLLLGILIWRQWPLSGLWVIGLFVGIELIFTGWTWVMLGASVRGIAKRGEERIGEE